MVKFLSFEMSFKFELHNTDIRLNFPMNLREHFPCCILLYSLTKSSTNFDNCLSCVIFQTILKPAVRKNQFYIHLSAKRLNFFSWLIFYRQTWLKFTSIVFIDCRTFFIDYRTFSTNKKDN